MTQILREYPRPDIDVEETEYGLKITALRHLLNEQTHVRVTNQIFPTAICIPVNKALMKEQRLKEHRLPSYAPLKNKENDYQFDPQEQETLTYTGMGLDINVHDQWAVEGMGPVQDRTQEHLGRSDVAIIRYRRMLRKAIAAVEENADTLDLPMLNSSDITSIKGPLSNDSIAPKADWYSASEQADNARRSACPWNATV